MILYPTTAERHFPIFASAFCLRQQRQAVAQTTFPSLTSRHLRPTVWAEIVLTRSGKTALRTFIPTLLFSPVFLFDNPLPLFPFLFCGWQGFDYFYNFFVSHRSMNFTTFDSVLVYRFRRTSFFEFCNRILSANQITHAHLSYPHHSSGRNSHLPALHLLRQNQDNFRIDCTCKTFPNVLLLSTFPSSALALRMEGLKMACTLCQR